MEIYIAKYAGKNIWTKNKYREREDYMEIVLHKYAILDEAREVRAKAEKKYFKDFRYKPIEVD